MADMTLEQKADKVYEYIRQYLLEEARPPSRREIIETLHISTETLGNCYHLLEEQERPIHRVKGRARQVWVPISEQPEEE